MRYDPKKPPGPRVWRALDEDEARLMIARHHRSPRCEHPPAPNQRVHDIIHLVVENQAADPDLPIAEALSRLVAEGLTRHEAVHAVGSAMSPQLFDALGPGAKAPDLAQYYADVRALTAESWRQCAEPGPALSNPFVTHGDDELLELLFTQEDRLPRTAVDQILVRGPRLLASLIAVVIDPRNWGEPRPGWWAPIHATFILAAISDQSCDAALLSALREADARYNDWILEAIPAILGARGARLRPTLMQILGKRTEPTGVRCAALDGLVASTVDDPEGREDIFARVGDVFTTVDEAMYLREHAGQVLLDFQVRAHEQALLDFARDAVENIDTKRTSGIPGAVAFSLEDVAQAFSEPQDLSRYRASWLDFYDDDAIAARQRRWQREETERSTREQTEQTPPKVGRNEPCPCGSGRKYKKCCLDA